MIFIVCSNLFLTFINKSDLSKKNKKGDLSKELTN